MLGKTQENHKEEELKHHNLEDTISIMNGHNRETMKATMKTKGCNTHSHNNFNCGTKSSSL